MHGMLPHASVTLPACPTLQGAAQLVSTSACT